MGRSAWAHRSTFINTNFANPWTWIANIISTYWKLWIVSIKLLNFMAMPLHWNKFPLKKNNHNCGSYCYISTATVDYNESTNDGICVLLTYEINLLKIIRFVQLLSVCMMLFYTRGSQSVNRVVFKVVRLSSEPTIFFLPQ